MTPNLAVNTDAPCAPLRAGGGSPVNLFRWASQGHGNEAGGDLLIEQPTKFEFVVNLKTAKPLGITIPESILLRAAEVIR